MTTVIIGTRLPEFMIERIETLRARARELREGAPMSAHTLPTHLVLVNPLTVEGAKRSEAIQSAVYSAVTKRSGFKLSSPNTLSCREDGSVWLEVDSPVAEREATHSLRESLQKSLGSDATHVRWKFGVQLSGPTANWDVRSKTMSAFTSASFQHRGIWSGGVRISNLCIFTLLDGEWECDCYTLQAQKAA